MAIPRRLIVLAVSAAAAGVMLYVSQRVKKQGEKREKSPIDEANEAKDKAEKDKKAKEESAEKKSSEPAEKTTDASSSSSSSSSTAAGAGTQKELALFLAGDAWHDEIGWQALWEKEGVGAPEDWLKTKGKEVLVAERKKLVDHPALLAGCRRRWIVVCRYAGIDVGDAAVLWNTTESA
ncbi:MAG: hypothetical protein Q8O67_28595 [Deltaproteobacteria bacterium]|nr:hypothetical protein [Deltaproteobacteria bacterium]